MGASVARAVLFPHKSAPLGGSGPPSNVCFLGSRESTSIRHLD